MDDFISRYRTQLLTARRRRRPHFSRPVLVAFTGVGLLAGGAAAATTSWLPDLGSDHPRNFSVDSSPPPEAQLRRLGVLRREQTEADRGVAQSYALRFFGDNTGAVRTDYVRSYASTPGSEAVLVPVRTYTVQRIAEDASGNPSVTSETANDGLCLFVGDNGAGGGQGCHSLADVENGRVRGAVASADSTRFFGLVPDGVTQVSVRRSGHTPERFAVKDNLYDFTLTPANNGAAIAIESLDWLAGDGRVIETQTDFAGGAPNPKAGKIQCGDGRVVDYPSSGRLDDIKAACDPGSK